MGVHGRVLEGALEEQKDVSADIGGQGRGAGEASEDTGEYWRKHERV